ncbi:MAG: flagellar basal-body MS-ring/collar protein FliF [Bacilli bacterium]
MNPTFAAWLKRLRTYYEGLESRQRRNLLLIAAVGIVTALVLSLVFLNPDYQVVFANLGAKSAGQITQKLQQMKIPYELQGNTILVPAAQADQVRIDMAMVGLPASGTVEYSTIFQQGSLLGMTSQELNLQVLGVLEQRIGQSIQSINGIENAQVNIVMPQSQTFLDPTANLGAKASVVLTVGPGMTLTSGQIFGVQQLVSHAVQGLSPQNVSIVDQYGNALSNSGTVGASAGLASQLQTELNLQQQLQTSLASQLQASLVKLVGPGNVQVVVHANVTFNRETQQKHIVSPGPALSSQTSSQSSTGGGTVGGIAGQATQNANAPTYGTTGAGGGSSSNRSATTNYDNSYTNTATTFDPIQLKGYTVSVMVNSAAVPLTARLSREIQSYVLTAAGQRATGAAAPSVTVLGIPFAPVAAIGGATGTFFGSPLGIGAIALLLAAGGVAAAVLVLRRRNRKQATDEALDSLSLASLVNMPSEPQDVAVSRQLKELASRRPEAFASLVRSWLSQE